ncbi:MAG: hypothetical protein ACM3Q4_00915 [Acidobacteriota bacterium]
MKLFKTAVVRTTLAIAAVCCLAAVGHAQQTKWMSVGAYQSWYSSSGAEIEEGRVQVQQDGMRWPAIYQLTDMEAAKGFWIGTTNYKDKDGKTYQHKVVHVGPRNKGQSEFFSTKFKMTSKFEPPVVSVTGVLSEGVAIDNDGVDPTLKADRMIESNINTSIGVSVTRKILGFSKKGHEDYNIIEYTFKNTGDIDNTGGKRDAVTLTGVYFYWQYRLAVAGETRYVIGNSSGWGVNTMNHAVGDTSVPSTFWPTPSPFASNLRASYAWHGKYSAFTGGYDNIGAPIFVPYYSWQKGDTVGRLGASQFVGVATLFAQKSPTEPVDDPKQPRTTSYEGSDETNNGNDASEAYNSNKMDAQYEWMSKGHAIPRHADKIGPNGDPSTGSQGAAGYSTTMGYGPYTLAPGDSIKIVVAEGAGGLSREANVAIGKAYKSAPAASRDAQLIPYNGVSKTKNDWVYTGRDSLFKTFQNAMANYASGYALAADVTPPPSTFSVNSGAGKISLSWTKYDNDAKTVGYQVWRAVGQYDSAYYKIWEGTGNSYNDTTAAIDVAHYYYVLGVDGAGNTSNRYYAQTYDPAYKRVAAPLELKKSDIRIVPNPYSLGADPTNLLYPGEQDKIAFKNIPGICTIKIYTETAELVKTIEHVDGTGTQDYDLTTNSRQIIVSGIYIAVISTPSGEKAIMKFVVIR